MDQGLIREAWHAEPGSAGDSSILQRLTWFRNLESNLRNNTNANRPFYILSDKGMQGINGIVTPQ